MTRPPRSARCSRPARSKPLETVVEGFERLPEALNMLFDGANTGKLSVKID